MSAVSTFYQQQVKPLPMIDRIQLARLIMDDLSEFISLRHLDKLGTPQAQSTARSNVDFDDAWSDEDLYDASRASMRYAAQILDDEDDYEEYEEYHETG